VERLGQTQKGDEASFQHQPYEFQGGPTERGL